MHGRQDRHLVDHFEIEAAIDKGVGLLGIVGEQANLPQAEILEQLDADAVVTGVGLEAEGEIRLDGIEAPVLQFVSTDLLHQTDAAALLRQVDQHAGPLAADHVERHVELVATVAPQAVEQVACEARRVKPHKRRRHLPRLSHHEHERLLRFILHAVGDHPEAAPLGRQIGLGDAVHQLLTLPAVPDQLLDRDDFEAMFTGHAEERLAVRPIADIVEDLAEHARRRKVCHPGEVDRGLGVSGTAEHASLFRDQGKEMTGPHEVGRRAGGIHDRGDRVGTFGGGDAGPRGAVVDRHGEGGAQWCRVRLHHHRQFKPSGDVRENRHTDLTAAKPDHEIDDVRRALFGSTDEIPFILPVLGIDHDHHLATANGGHGGVDRRKFCRHGDSSVSLIIGWGIGRPSPFPATADDFA